MKFRYYLLSLVLLLVVSCKSYSYIGFEVLRPAEYSLPPEITSLLIVKNAPLYQTKDIHTITLSGRKIVLDQYWMNAFSDSVIAGLAEQLRSRHFFDTIYVDYTDYYSQTNTKGEWSDDALKTINKRYGASAILSIDAFAYTNSITVDKIESSFYYALLKSCGRVKWRLYDTYSHQSLFTKVQTDTIFWEGLGGSVDMAIKTFPTIESVTNELALFLGQEYANTLAPRWEKVDRKIYTSGSSLFSSAIEWLNMGNRDEAEKIWVFAYENGNNRTKARAAYNVAVSMEQRGELLLARDWAMKSVTAFKALKSSFYAAELLDAQFLFSQLELREKESKALFIQLGI